MHSGDGLWIKPQEMRPNGVLGLAALCDFFSKRIEFFVEQNVVLQFASKIIREIFKKVIRSG